MARAVRTQKTRKGKRVGAKRAGVKAAKKTASKKSPGKKTSAKKTGKSASKSTAKVKASSTNKKAKAVKKTSKSVKAAKAVSKSAAKKKVKAKKKPKTNLVAKPKLAAAAKQAPVTEKTKVSKKTPKTSSSMSASPLSATSQDPIQFPELDRRVPKTHLKAKELREFRTLLRLKRAELAGDVEHLSTEVTNRSSDGGGDHSAMPIHMADLGSDNWEKEFTMGLIANERDRIRDIDDALERIEAKTYGTCLATHRPISDARLRAKPWAKYCIDFARAREEGRA